MMPMPPVSPTPAGTEIVSRQNASTPGVAIMLWIVGSLSVAIGAIGTIVSLQDSGNSTGDIAFGIACIVSGLIVIGTGTIIDRLSRIEHHLRPENRTSSSEALPKIGLL
jgi:hypothetical protein